MCWQEWASNCTRSTSPTQVPTDTRTSRPTGAEEAGAGCRRRTVPGASRTIITRIGKKKPLASIFALAHACCRGKLLLMMRINGVARGATPLSSLILWSVGRTVSRPAGARPASNLFNLGFWLSATGLDERAAIWDKRRNDKKRAFVRRATLGERGALFSRNVSDPMKLFSEPNSNFQRDKRRRLIGLRPQGRSRLNLCNCRFPFNLKVRGNLARPSHIMRSNNVGFIFFPVRRFLLIGAGADFLSDPWGSAYILFWFFIPVGTRDFYEGGRLEVISFL